MEVLEEKKTGKGARLASATALMLIPAAMTVGMGSVFASALTDIVDDTASGAISTASTVAAGPAGTIVYTIMGIGLLIVVIGLIYSLKSRR